MAIQKPGNLFPNNFLHSSDHRIYLDANNPDFRSLDLCNIDKNKNGLNRQWLHQLLKDGTAEIKIEAKTEAISGLFHLYFESHNIKKLKGQKTLAFAYPLYYERKTPESPEIVSPLFLWRLDLSTDSDGNWSISHNGDLRLFPNDYLLNDLKIKYDFDLTDLCRSLCLSRQLNSISLSKIIHKLVSGLKLPATGNHEIEPIKDALNSVGSEKAAILKSGFIGIFPNQGEAGSIENKSNQKPLINLYSPQHHFSFVAPDPFQNSVVQTIFDHRSTVIEGPQGSGKTLSLCNALGTALSNGRRSLVIIDSTATQEKIIKYFKEKKLDRYCFNLLDPNHSIQQLIQNLRKKEEAIFEFDETTYRFIVNKAKRARNKLEEQVHLKRAAFFENENWQKIVGKFLKNNREEGKELLNSQLNPLDFDFIIPEYESMKKAVRESRNLFLRLKTFSHPLRYLNRNIFLNHDKEEARFFVEEQITDFQLKARVLHHRYILKQDDYSRKLRTHYERYYRELWEKLEKIKEDIDDYTELYGEDFIESGLSLKVYGVFSNRAKNILQARSEINKQYIELRNAFKTRDYFDFNFYENIETKNTHRINAQLDEFESTLNEWRQTLNVKVQEEVQRLSNKTVHPNLDYQEQIDELEYALDLLAEELNTAQLYEQAFQNKMLTIPMRQQYLEGIIDQLDESMNNLRDFDAFYDWNRYWLSLPDIIRKLIRALVKVRPKNWNAAFESWYFYHLLNNHYQPRFPEGNKLFDEYSEAHEQLVKLMPTQISKLWSDRFLQSKKQLKKTEKKIYQLLFKSGSESYRQFPLEKYIETAFDTITDRFPVFLATTSEAEKILRLDSVYFDFISSYQTIHQPHSKWPKNTHKANHTALFTDTVLPENIAKTQLYGKSKRIKLSMLHLQQDINLSRFVNAAFYNNQLKIRFKNKQDKLAVEVLPVDGRYQSKERFNKKEAEHIVQKLKDLTLNEHFKTSRIGVACATVEQRNLILKMLLQQSEKALFNEIFVLEFEALKTHVFDVLLVSMVYDKIPYQSGQQEGFNYSTPAQIFRSLFSNILHRFVLCHSFSEDQILEFSKLEKVNAPLLLSRFIQYGKACQAGDIEKQNETLALFQPGPENTALNLFSEEIALALSPYFEGGRILKDFVYKGVLLPLAIKSDSPGSPPIAIIQDGFLETPSSPAYLWENHIREQLASAGIQTYSVWSVNWWRNPKLEARKLASAVIKMSS